MGVCAVWSGSLTLHNPGLSKREDPLWAQGHHPAFHVGEPVSEDGALTQHTAAPCLFIDINTCVGML